MKNLLSLLLVLSQLFVNPLVRAETVEENCLPENDTIELEVVNSTTISQEISVNLDCYLDIIDGKINQMNNGEYNIMRYLGNPLSSGVRPLFLEFWKDGQLVGIYLHNLGKYR